MIMMCDEIRPLSILELHAVMNSCMQTCRRTEAHVSHISESVNSMQQQFSMYLAKDHPAVQQCMDSAVSDPSIGGGVTAARIPPRTRVASVVLGNAFPSLSYASRPRTPSISQSCEQMLADISSKIDRLEVLQCQGAVNTAPMAKAFEPVKGSLVTQVSGKVSHNDAASNGELSSLMSRIEQSHTEMLLHLREMWKMADDEQAELMNKQCAKHRDYPMLSSALAQAFSDPQEAAAPQSMPRARRRSVRANDNDVESDPGYSHRRASISGAGR